MLERSTNVPLEITMVIQAIITLLISAKFLSVFYPGIASGRRKKRRGRLYESDYIAVVINSTIRMTMPVLFLLHWDLQFVIR